MTVTIPEQVAVACGSDPERLEWLRRLPTTVNDLSERWRLHVGPPIQGRDVSCSWVAPVRQGRRRAVLKLGMPHMEARDELRGLRFWDGDPTVHLLDADGDANAMLLEACEPGHSLRSRPEPEQDVVIAGMLRRLWRRPGFGHSFRPLAVQTAFWSAETANDRHRWPDAGQVEEGLARNVLSATRRPWLAIDPKPFVGDCAYDATQHLLNCRGRLRAEPRDTVRRFSDRVEVDAERIRLWLFARLVAEPRHAWDDDSLAVALSLS